MSLAIQVDDVGFVLLADGWHEVAGKSFDLDSYEYIQDDLVLHGGGNSGICATGFSFVNAAGNRVYGPLSAILAVRCTP